jgi:hypothetical protein
VEDLGLGGRIRLKGTFKTLDGDVVLIEVAGRGYRWRIVVNAVLHFRVL